MFCMSSNSGVQKSFIGLEYEFNKIHNNKYDYSCAEYKGKERKIKIICPIHGPFYQIPSNHLKGCECNKCSQLKNKNKKIPLNEFIKKSNKIHNNRYSNYKYLDNSTKIYYECEIHGGILQSYNSHLKGHGCQKCANSDINQKNKAFTTKSFIEAANKIHNNKFNYSKTKYITRDTNLIIICPLHGEFTQTPINHLQSKYGCPICNNSKPIKWLKTTEKFIEEANKIHNNKYDYSKTEYIKNDILVKIICPRHGEFKQKPHIHLSGCGCQFCGESLKRLKYFNRPTFLYFVKLKFKNGKVLYKVGITSKNKIEDRFKTEIKEGIIIDILHSELFNHGKDAYFKEQLIINTFKEYKYNGDSVLLSGGNTELFNINVLQL